MVKTVTLLRMEASRDIPPHEVRTRQPAALPEQRPWDVRHGLLWHS
jgi:hypothetical protein